MLEILKRLRESISTPNSVVEQLQIIFRDESMCLRRLSFSTRLCTVSIMIDKSSFNVELEVNYWWNFGLSRHKLIEIYKRSKAKK